MGVGGMTLLERACRLVETSLERKPILVGDNLDVGEYSQYDILCDALPNRGPLGGLVSCLRNCPTPWALVLAVDMPFLEPSHLELLRESCDESLDVITLGSGERIEPLIALYRSGTLEFWTDRLKNGKLSLQEGIQFLRFRTIEVPRSHKTLLNLNRPDDFGRFDRMTAKKEVPSRAAGTEMDRRDSEQFDQ